MRRLSASPLKARGQVLPLRRPVPTSGATPPLRGDAGAGGGGGQRGAVKGGGGQARAGEGFGERTYGSDKKIYPIWGRIW